MQKIKVSLVYRYPKFGNGSAYVDRVYLLPHSARARKAKLRAQGVNGYIVKRTLR